MLLPQKVKYRKRHKGRIKGKATNGCDVSFGSFGLLCLESGRISNRQIESARIAINRYIKRGGKVWIRIFPDKPISKKPLEVRMGKGKGSPDSWVAVVKPGKMLYELDGVSEEVAREAMRLASHKLCVKTKFITKDPF